MLITVLHNARRRASVLVVALGALLSVTLLLYLSRDLSFFHDEWNFILNRRTTGLETFLKPHNEHLHLVPIVSYKILLGLVGLRSYMPYMAILLAFHAAVGVLMYLLIRRRAGDFIAAAASLVVLFLGSAWEDLLWAVEIAIVAAVAFGLAALLALDGDQPRRPHIVVALLSLLLSIATSLVGLIFVVAIAAESFLEKKKKRHLLWVPTLAAVAYLLWLSQYRGSLSAHRDPFTLSAFLSLPGYVIAGLAATTTSVAGLSAAYGPPLLLAAVIGLVALWVRRFPFSARTTAMLVALIAQFAGTGLVRAQFGEEQATSSRYMYPSVVFLLLLLTSLVTAVRLAWRTKLIVVAAVTLSLVGNLTQLAAGSALLTKRAAAQRAVLQTVELFRESPDLNREARLAPIYMSDVTLQSYFDTIELFGSPYGRPHLASLMAQPQDIRNTIDEVLFHVFRHTLGISETDARTDIAGSPPGLEKAESFVSRSSGACLDLVFSGAESLVHITMPSATALLFRTTRTGPIRITLALMGDFHTPNSLGEVVKADRFYWLPLPDVRDLLPWRLRLELPAEAGEVKVCADTAREHAAFPSDPLVWIDEPAKEEDVTGIVIVRGWAIDRNGGMHGPGVESITIYLDGEPGSGVRLGTAQYGEARPDVAAHFRNSRFASSGWRLRWDSSVVTEGKHTLYVVARSTSANRSTVVKREINVSRR